MKFSQAKPQHFIRELKLEGLAEPHLSGQQGCTRGRIPTGVASGSKRWENIHSLTQQIFIEELLLARHCARSFCWLAMRQTEVFEAITDNENKSCLTKFSTLWLQKPSWKISLYQASVSGNVLIVVVIGLSNKLSFSYWIIVCAQCPNRAYSLWPRELQPTRLLCPWDFPGMENMENILHRIFSKNMEWVAVSSSKGSFQYRNQNCISCVSSTAGGFFTTEPPGESLNY